MAGWQVGSEQAASENGFDQVSSYLLQSHDTATALMMIVKVMMMRCDGDDEDVLIFSFIVNISTVVIFTIIIIL